MDNADTKKNVTTFYVINHLTSFHVQIKKNKKNVMQEKRFVMTNVPSFLNGVGYSTRLSKEHFCYVTIQYVNIN